MTPIIINPVDQMMVLWSFLYTVLLLIFKLKLPKRGK